MINEVPNTKFVTDKLEFSNVDGDGLTSFAAKFWLNWIGSTARRGKLALKSDTEILDHQADSSMPNVDDAVIKTEIQESRSSFPLSAKETFKAALIHFSKKWHRRLSFLWKHATHIVGSLWVSRLRQPNSNSKIIHGEKMKIIDRAFFNCHLLWFQFFTSKTILIQFYLHVICG